MRAMNSWIPSPGFCREGGEFEAGTLGCERRGGVGRRISCCLGRRIDGRLGDCESEAEMRIQTGIRNLKYNRKR